MKKIFLLFSLVIAATFAKAQQNTETKLPLVKYSIIKADSSVATPAALNKKKPVMVIYFEPSCTHCEHLMDELRPKMNELKTIQVIMITYTKTEYPFLKLLKDFNKKYNLAKYPNFTVGTEYTPRQSYPVMHYYTIYTTPFIIIYGTNGKVVKSFANVPAAQELLAAVKKAK
jgi:protein-disulfide isomerase